MRLSYAWLRRARRGIVGGNLNPSEAAGRSPGWGLTFGRYPGWTDTPPTAYWERGRQLASQVFARDVTGAINWVGSIGIADFSGSLGHLAWGTQQALGDSSQSSLIAYARTSNPGRPIQAMTDPSLPEYSDYWGTWVPARLVENGLVASQVGLAFIENGFAFGGGAVVKTEHYADWRQFVSDLKGQLLLLRDEVVTRFPNVRLVLFTQYYTFGYCETGVLAEPYAWLWYFAIQSLIHDFITSGEYATSPVWLGWGPVWWQQPGLSSGGWNIQRGYLKNYADGGDSDGIHLNATGLNAGVPAVLTPFLRAAGTPVEAVYTERALPVSPALGTASGTTASSFTTGAFDLPAGALVLLSVLTSVVSGTPNIPTISGTAAGWTQVNTRVQGIRRLTVFRAASAAGESGVTLTLDFSGQSQATYRAAVVRVNNADWSAGDQGVVQSGTNSVASGTSLTVTLANDLGYRNSMLGYWGASAGSIGPDSESSLAPPTGLGTLGGTVRGNPSLVREMGCTAGSGAILGVVLEIRRQSYSG